MPNLQPHVTSLDLSLALKKAGWPQGESVFYWTFPKGESLPAALLLRDEDSPFPVEWEKADAYLSTELMERVPQEAMLLVRNKVCENNHPECATDKYNVGILPIGKMDWLENSNDSIPNGLAKLALHLIKEGIIRF